MCARRFTAADVSVGYALLLASHIGLEPAFKPAVRTYWERLRGREGFLRARRRKSVSPLSKAYRPCT
jgi:glutathione S-transferase